MNMTFKIDIDRRKCCEQALQQDRSEKGSGISQKIS